MEWVIILLVIVGFLLTIACVLYLILNGVRVEANEIGIMYRTSVLSRPLPSNRRIALNDNESGPQADILGSGWYWWSYPAWKYTIRKVSLTKIPAGQIGLVIAKDGDPVPLERQLGKVVPCDDFQNARAFLENHGQMGQQLGILPAGVYGINTELFEVITTDNAEEHGLEPNDLQVYKIESNRIGIVTTFDGKPLPIGEIAGPTIPGHNNFQNGQNFIDNGGYRGLQEEFLTAGGYNLNPWFVKVEQIPLTRIPNGTVGVIVSYVGKTSKDYSNETPVERGYKGTWEIPLYPGEHPINTKVMKVEVVPTHEITLDWSNKPKPDYNYDKSLAALQLSSQDGFDFEIGVTQVFKIDGRDAPRMISLIGSEASNKSDPTVPGNSDTERYNSIKNLVTRKLEPLISSHSMSLR